MCGGSVGFVLECLLVFCCVVWGFFKGQFGLPCANNFRD